jgi:hypothetical protein
MPCQTLYGDGVRALVRASDCNPRDTREDRQGGAEGGAAADIPVRRSSRGRKPKQRS